LPSRLSLSFGRQPFQVVLRDFVAEGTGLAENSVSHAMVFNILHAENPMGCCVKRFESCAPAGK
jgi:hypothetical protein